MNAIAKSTAGAVLGIIILGAITIATGGSPLITTIGITLTLYLGSVELLRCIKAIIQSK